MTCLQISEWKEMLMEESAQAMQKDAEVMRKKGYSVWRRRDQDVWSLRTTPLDARVTIEGPQLRVVPGSDGDDGDAARVRRQRRREFAPAVANAE